jgi:hypothetical protein
MAKLESLIVDLQIESAELRKGLDDIKKKLEETNEAAEGLLNFEKLKEVGHLAVEAAEKLGELVIGGAEAADKVGKLAAASQVGVEGFQRLSYAAKLGGSSAEELGGAFNKLNKALGEASQGSIKQESLFRALGVGLKDLSGNAKGPEEVFRELATKLNEMAPGYAKATLEQELFGRSGTAMDATLKNVAEGLADAGGEADKFGLVLSEGAIAAATDFKDNLERVELAVNGLGAQVAAELAPALKGLTDEFLHSKAGAESLKEAVTILAGAVKVLVTAAIGIAAAFEYQWVVVKGIVNAQIALFHDDLTGAINSLKDTQKELGVVTENAARRFGLIWKDNESTFEEAKKAHKGLAESVLADQKRMEEGAKALEARFKEAKALADKLTEEHFAEGETAHKTAGIAQAGAERQERFDNQSRNVDVIIAETLKGFQNFDDALSQYTQAQIGIANEQAAMAEAKRNKDVEAYDFALAALQNQEEIARRAGKAAEQFEILAEKIRQQHNTFEGAMGALSGAILRAVPRVNEIVQAAQQGAAVGGIWGALIAVFVELISKTEGFKRILDIVGGDLDQLIHGLEPLVNGIADLMDALDPITNMITGIIASSLGPLGVILKILAPILKLIAGALALILSPIQALADFASSRFSKLGGIVDGMVKAFDDAFHEIDKAIHAVENWIASVTKSIPTEFVAQGTGQVIVKAPEIDVKVVDFAKDSVKDLGDSSAKTAKTLDRLTDSFTNVPEGFRLAARTFGATDPIGGGLGAAGASATGGGAVTQYIFHVQGSLVTEKELFAKASKEQAKTTWQKSGKPPLTGG